MAVTLVAISRSSVSGRVVYRSRGKPLNAERVVFITMRSSTPASTVVPPRGRGDRRDARPLAAADERIGRGRAGDVDRGASGAPGC